MTTPEDGWVAVGQLHGPFGVKGWVRVLPFTDPVERILAFPDWWIGTESQVAATPGANGLKKIPVLSGQKHTRGVVVQLQGVQTPEAAQVLSGLEVWVPRAALPEPEEDSHYWADLVGLQVVETTGNPLGVVAYLFATGANDVLVVQEPDGEERLLPFTREVIQTVDLEARTITVSLLPGM